MSGIDYDQLVRAAAQNQAWPTAWEVLDAITPKPVAPTRDQEIEALAERIHVARHADDSCDPSPSYAFEAAEKFIRARDDWRAKRKAAAEGPAS